jgi:hypothetical protein
MSPEPSAADRKAPRMIRAAWVALAMVILASPAVAQQTIKILTPTDDTCAAFMATIDSASNPAKTVGLGGWVLGFLSGFAEGAGRDILRGATAEAVMTRLYAACQRQPNRLMSMVLEEMARSLVSGHQ